GPVHGRRGAHPADAWLRRIAARVSTRAEEGARDEADGRPLQEGRDRDPDEGSAGGPPAEDGERSGVSGGTDVDGGSIHPRRVRGRGRRNQGQGVPGRREATWLVRWRRDPRIDVPSRAGF